jgi:hypothetical protein
MGPVKERPDRGRADTAIVADHALLCLPMGYVFGSGTTLEGFS